MRKLKTLMMLFFAASLLLISAPSAHALSLAPGFNTPVTLTLQPGQTTYLLCTASSSNIKAVVERLTNGGKVVGPYYFNMSNRGQIQMGTMSGTNVTQELYFSYWDQSSGNALLYLNAADTTTPIQVKVTFYNLNN